MLTLWKDADVDIPILKQAKAESVIPGLLQVLLQVITELARNRPTKLEGK